MNINDAIKLLNKLALPNDASAVMEDHQGDFVLINTKGELADDQAQKEFDALVFKAEHPLAPKGWRKWISKRGKEF